MYDVADQHPTQIIKYARNIQTLVNLQQRPRVRGPSTVWYLWGDAGCGKSRVAFDLAVELGNGEIPYMASDQREGWFDNYSGQKVVLFDDFVGDINARLLYRLLDRLPIQMPVKGAFCPVNATLFIFTSNIDPSNLYLGSTHQAFIRRLNNIWGQKKVVQEHCLRYGGPPPHFNPDGDAI